MGKESKHVVFPPFDMNFPTNELIGILLSLSLSRLFALSFRPLTNINTKRVKVYDRPAFDGRLGSVNVRELLVTYDGRPTPVVEVCHYVAEFACLVACTTSRSCIGALYDNPNSPLGEVALAPIIQAFSDTVSLGLWQMHPPPPTQVFAASVNKGSPHSLLHHTPPPPVPAQMAAEHADVRQKGLTEVEKEAIREWTKSVATARMEHLTVKLRNVFFTKVSRDIVSPSPAAWCVQLFLCGDISLTYLLSLPFPGPYGAEGYSSQAVQAYTQLTSCGERLLSDIDWLPVLQSRARCI